MVSPYSLTPPPAPVTDIDTLVSLYKPVLVASGTVAHLSLGLNKLGGSRHYTPPIHQLLSHTSPAKSSGKAPIFFYFRLFSSVFSLTDRGSLIW